MKEGVGLDFWMPTEYLYGLGEREDTLYLKKTTYRTPYQLFATDRPHKPDETQPLYGSVPFIHGLTKDKSTALAWINSAHTWAWIYDE